MIWYDKNIARVFTFLDTKDLSKFLDKYKGHEVRELMDTLELLFPYKDEKSSSLFDYVAEDEFIMYIGEKYNTRVREQTTVKNYIL